MHWVSAAHAVDTEVRLYDRLFKVENPMAEENWLSAVNPESLKVLTHCKLEPALGEMKPGAKVQFERVGYFCVDTKHTDRLVFNRTATLKDSWARIERQGE